MKLDKQGNETEKGKKKKGVRGPKNWYPDEMEERVKENTLTR